MVSQSESKVKTRPKKIWIPACAGMTAIVALAHIYGMNETQMRQNPRIARLSKRLVGRDITQPLTAPLPPPDESKIPNLSHVQQPPLFVKSGAIGRISYPSNYYSNSI